MSGSALQPKALGETNRGHQQHCTSLRPFTAVDHCTLTGRGRLRLHDEEPLVDARSQIGLFRLSNKDCADARTDVQISNGDIDNKALDSRIDPSSSTDEYLEVFSQLEENQGRPKQIKAAENTAKEGSQK